MAIDITNGTAVSRFYSDGSGELLAVFQYETHAKEWARTLRKIDLPVVVTNLYSGRSTMFVAGESNDA